MSDDLVGAAEASEILGVSTVQVGRLARRDDFPAPAARLRMGNVWRREEVELWARENAGRRPGRRPRSPQ